MATIEQSMKITGDAKVITIGGSSIIDTIINNNLPDECCCRLVKKRKGKLGCCFPKKCKSISSYDNVIKVIEHISSAILYDLQFNINHILESKKDVLSDIITTEQAVYVITNIFKLIVTKYLIIYSGYKTDKKNIVIKNVLEYVILNFYKKIK